MRKANRLIAMHSKRTLKKLLFMLTAALVPLFSTVNSRAVRSATDRPKSKLLKRAEIISATKLKRVDRMWQTLLAGKAILSSA